jgi:uncharacterized membrane protein
MRLVLALAALMALTGPANAALSVCNKSVHPVRVALGLFNGKQWASKGWWIVAPKKCAELVTGRLRARYYYLYATDELFGVWDGDKNFCVTVFMKFAIEGRSRCTARGYYRLGFLEVDTGDKADWTQSFSDPR